MNKQPQLCVFVKRKPMTLIPRILHLFIETYCIDTRYFYERNVASLIITRIDRVPPSQSSPLLSLREII